MTAFNPNGEDCASAPRPAPPDPTWLHLGPPRDVPEESEKEPQSDEDASREEPTLPGDLEHGVRTEIDLDGNVDENRGKDRKSP
jgi:hypothetical protein